MDLNFSSKFRRVAVDFRELLFVVLIKCTLFMHLVISNNISRYTERVFKNCHGSNFVVLRVH